MQPRTGGALVRADINLTKAVQLRKILIDMKQNLVNTCPRQ